ncbi:MAG TPA: hypothetical protein ENK21_10855 [Trueperaceae bacterium]|nr:hypothetical protein [Trueperaceae bacterium]
MIFISALILSSCGGDTAVKKQTTYFTTSSKGDYSDWTIVDNLLTAVWHVVNSSGAIDYSYNFTANCALPVDDGSRLCTINPGATCTNGVAVCTDTPSGVIRIMEVPGVALYALSNDDFQEQQLHVGFAKDSGACSQNVSGDYTMIHSGLGLRDNFGVYRSDTNFLNVLHADFGFDTSSALVTPTVKYNSSSEAESLTDLGCSDGVRVRRLGTDTIRAMLTQSGLFVLDLPAGQGGLLSFKTNRAAQIADFANKNFGGVSFPDNSGPRFVKAVSSALTANRVGLAAGDGSSTINLRIMPLTTADLETSPGYPNFATSPTGYSTPGSVLAAGYPAPKDIPGLFKLDGLTDAGRVILSAMEYNSKIIVIGMVYNHRTTSETNPATGLHFTENNLYNTGNFILFEK